LYYTQRKTLAPKAILLEDSSASMELKHGSSAKAASLKPWPINWQGSFGMPGTNWKHIALQQDWKVTKADLCLQKL
jgi:hypothetical protein